MRKWITYELSSPLGNDSESCCILSLLGSPVNINLAGLLIEKTRKSGTIHQCISRERMCHFYMVCIRPRKWS